VHTLSAGTRPTPGMDYLRNPGVTPLPQGLMLRSLASGELQNPTAYEPVRRDMRADDGSRATFSPSRLPNREVVQFLPVGVWMGRVLRLPSTDDSPDRLCILGCAPIKKPPLQRDFSKAANGARTHDLLHGKRLKHV
jgi:hypothetical protein